MDKRATIGIIITQDPVSYDLCHSFYHTYFIYPRETVARYGAAFVAQHAKGCSATPVIRLKRVEGLLWECLHSGIQHFVLPARGAKPPQAYYARSFSLFLLHTWIRHIWQDRRFYTLKVRR